MVKTTKNWIEFAEYDLATAKSLLKAKREVYVIFMCHLAIEKTLKGLFSAKFNKLPPYTHNLIYPLNLLELKPNILWRKGNFATPKLPLRSTVQPNAEGEI